MNWYRLRSSWELANAATKFQGQIVQAAIENSLSVDTVVFHDGVCLDIGTPVDLKKASCTPTSLLFE